MGARRPPSMAPDGPFTRLPQRATRRRADSDGRVQNQPWCTVLVGEWIKVAMSTVQPGSRVTLHYRIMLADGQIMDASGDEPFSFILGDGNLDPGLEAYLIGLEVATQREFSIGPGEVFPWPVASAVHPLPRSDFTPDMRLEPGLIYEFTTPAGDAVPGSIVAVTAEQVTVDFNHPLAGQALRFWVEICAIA